jgi:phosphoribosyl-ATP pyrophosphohydrolase/phosphoribosyl-AMP cyclohydrolase
MKPFTLNINNIEQIKFDESNGLIPVIVQDIIRKRVLMLGYMNQFALAETFNTGFVTFWSRSKQRLWMKGETSGNTLQVISVQQDCDNDALLIQVKAKGPCCHLEKISCFDGECDNSAKYSDGNLTDNTMKKTGDNPANKIAGNASDEISNYTAKINTIDFLNDLYAVLENRKKTLPTGSYSASLFSAGIDQINAKIIEEAYEVVQAAKYESLQRRIEESCDLIFHLFILLVENQITLSDIISELKKRIHSSPRDKTTALT